MAVFKLRIYWEDDDQIYRDIDIISGQSILAFHQAILKAYEYTTNLPAWFFESNDKWQRLRGFHSSVESNKKGAEWLSMIKTPLSALINQPDQKFLYTYDPEGKAWQFHIELIGIQAEPNPKLEYPVCTRKEGLTPALFGTAGLENNPLLEIEEQYDLGQEEMDSGFSSEGESDTAEADI